MYRYLSKSFLFIIICVVLVLGALFLYDKVRTYDLSKRFKGARMIKLPKPKYQGMSLEEALIKRRSVRTYTEKPVTIGQLSQLLFAAQGITGRVYGKPLRAAPSAGALYPFEIYLIVNNVEDIPPGIYHYAIKEHALEEIKQGDFRIQIIDAGWEQNMLGTSGVTFALSAVFDRIRSKYGERGMRYIYMEAGHISQNIYLQATSLGLGSVAVGAFSDKDVNKLMGLDGKKEAIVYLHPVGSM